MRLVGEQARARAPIVSNGNTLEVKSQRSQALLFKAVPFKRNFLILHAYHMRMGDYVDGNY